MLSVRCSRAASVALGVATGLWAPFVRSKAPSPLALLCLFLMTSRYHSAAVTLSGKLFTWGHGRGGRLGHGNEDVCMLPTMVEALAHKEVTQVAASDTHTAAVTADGELFTWGRDRFGQVSSTALCPTCNSSRGLMHNMFLE